MAASNITGGSRSFVIDGLRGSAAICVMVTHLHGLFSSGQTLPSAYLAVDMFFMLSGVVLNRLYARDGMLRITALAFFQRRLSRLYPTYLLGFFISVVGFLIAIRAGSHSPYSNYRSFFADAVPNAFVLPSPGRLGDPESLFRTNVPAWSIFFEIAVNIIFAFVVVRSRSALAVLVGSFALLVFMVAVHFGGLNVGARWSDLLGGGVRVSYGFFMGVLLDRTRVRWPWRLPVASASAPILIVALFIPNLVGASRIAYDCTVSLVAFPLLLSVVLDNEASCPPRPIVWLMSLAGSVSYPLYIVHMPMVYLLAGAWARIFGHAPPLDAPFSGLFFAAVCLVLAALIARALDLPIQAALSRWQNQRELAASAEQKAG